MRFAFMTFSTPDLGLGEVLETAQRHGYDGVEVRVAADHRHGLEYATPSSERAQARELAAEMGVAFACVATSCVFADPARSPASIEDARRAVDLAASIGAPCVRVFGGTIGTGLTRADAVAQVAQSLATVADQALSAGVTLCMETHDDWCDPAHVAAVMTSVGHAAVAVNWDIMHPVRTGLATIRESFETLRPWIRHLHVHDCAAEDPNSLAPIGDGMIDHGEAIALLRCVDYPGFLSGEWIGWEPAEVHLPREIARLRALCR